jgi:hypothetical protein
MFGLFNDEGMVEGDFVTKAAAEAAIVDRYDPEDELEACECCGDHPEQRADYCEACTTAEVA